MQFIFKVPIAAQLEATIITKVLAKVSKQIDEMENLQVHAKAHVSMDIPSLALSQCR